MIFENSSDVIAVATCVGTVAVSVIAAVRYSRCVYIKCCCMECKRKIKDKKGDHSPTGEGGSMSSEGSEVQV